MTIYGYRCRTCGQEYLSETRADALDMECRTDGCAGRPTRDYSGISLKRPMQEHWNRTLGKPISDEKRFATELRVAGDQYTQRTGIPTDYQPVDMSDAAALGVTGEGLDSTNRARVAAGKPPIRIPGII